MKTIKKLVVFMFFLLLLNIGNINIFATKTISEKVIDGDIVLSPGSGTMVITDQGSLYVTGLEFNGEFGDGNPTGQDNPLNDSYNEFTKIDISYLDSKPIDIISSLYGTTILTEKGSVYRTGSFAGVSNQDQILDKYTKIDQALFDNKKVKKVYRTIYYTIYQTEDDSLYMSGFYTDGNFSVKQFNAPPLANGIKKVMMSTGMGTIHVLDNSGKVWFTDDYYGFISDNQFVIPWQQVKTVDTVDVVVKDMVTINYPYFLLDNGKIMFSGSYVNLNGDYMDYVDLNKMEYTDITDVTELIPFYAPFVHSPFPNVRKSNGEIYIGKEIIENFGLTLTEPDAMVSTKNYLPGSNNASFLTIRYPINWTDASSAGSYTVDGVFNSINSDEFATNGVYSADPTTNPPFEITKQVFGSKIEVIDPETPIFDNKINPKTATLPPKQSNDIPIQANWQIKDSSGKVVKSGKISESNAVATLSISSLNLADGTYTLSFFRETTADYTTEYLRSASTASNTFTINKTPLTLNVKSTIKYKVETKVDEKTFLKDINASTNKQATITTDFNKVVDLNKVGTYKVSVVASDSLNNKVTKTVIVTIYKEDVPDTGDSVLNKVLLLLSVSLLVSMISYTSIKTRKHN